MTKVFVEQRLALPGSAKDYPHVYPLDCWFSLNRPSGPIQSLSCDVRELSVFLSFRAIRENPLHSGLETSG